MKLEVSKELRDSVEENQICLKRAIIVHQTIYQKVLQDLEDEELRKNLAVAEQKVLKFGLEQKFLLRKLRAELCSQGKLSQKNSSKSILEEKKQQLATNLVRSRKQKIAPKASPKASCSDDSNEDSSKSPSPKLISNVKSPELLAQIDFLRYFSLTTLELSKEMQKKRVERKRRSTAIRDFIYETDLPSKKRKQNNYPSSISPPNTRQSVKKKNGRSSPPAAKQRIKLSKRSSSESIPETINENSNGEEISDFSSSVCYSCKNDGAIIQCELCMECFHENCDEPTLLGTSKRCPGCADNKKKSKKKLGYLEKRLVKSSEKIAEKLKLQDQNESLCVQLNQLQERHSQLSISLKNQKVRQEELLSDRQNTEEKIKCILNFIEAVKRSPVDQNT